MLSTDPMSWSFRDLCQAAAMLDTDERMVAHLTDHAARPEVRQRLRVLLRLIDDEGEAAPFSQLSRQLLTTMVGD